MTLREFCVLLKWQNVVRHQMKNKQRVWRGDEESATFFGMNEYDFSAICHLLVTKVIKSNKNTCNHTKI